MGLILLLRNQVMDKICVGIRFHNRRFSHGRARWSIINPAMWESIERLADSESPNKILDSILDEIKIIGKSHEFVHWRDSSYFAQSLARLINNIETLLLPSHPKDALTALDAFLKISPRIMDRVDDSSGNISDEFRYAVTVWGKAWNLFTDFNGETLAKAIWNYFDTNDYGLFDDMISAACEALKRNGLRELEQLAKSKCISEKSKFSLFHVLRDIALLKQSPEDFINTFKFTNRDMSVSDQLVLAKLFIDTSRVDEAIDLLESIKSDYDAYKRINLLIDAYILKENKNRVQELRWDGFVKLHRKDLFKDYYDNLSSDEEKKNAIDSAINVALTWDIISSISLLFDMNQHNKAADLLLEKYDALQGDSYHALKDIAEEFTTSHFPLQAILIYRRLTEDILKRAQSKYYHHAITYLKKSKQISAYVQDWKCYPTTSSYLNQLKELHRRKPSFMEKFENI